MSSRWIHVTYLTLSGASLIATVIATILMRPQYHYMQIMIVWLLGMVNAVWPIASLLQYRVDRTNSSGYEQAISDRKTPFIMAIVMNVIAIGMAFWILQKPLG